MAADKLREYHRKRDFKKTPEPRGRSARRSRQPRFVVQEHAARSHHYDFRLEVDGVLKSWAVPKGPSTNPKEKRLATQTEDHPLDYIDFEGIIPPGEYGAGTVIVWDIGTYRNLTDDGNTPIEEGLKKGHIRVFLEGKKLRGTWALTRFRDNQWLLVKTKDDKADARRNLVKSRPESVKSGRTLEEVAAEAAS
ncbi:MAG TPA: DNA polymerase ligase N-terminal domain-containing protein [Acidimicrobiia bacterium]|nr:DNA polymerase ligase N-terminal domain-containing protein [Acidimicrobiia bacterium]